MKLNLSLLAAALCLLSCNNNIASPSGNKEGAKTSAAASSLTGHYTGTFSNGMKGNKLSFDVDGSEVRNLTFEGYWRCDGKLELTTLGPEKAFMIKGATVEGVITEPEGGAAPFRFELQGTFSADSATGTFRIYNGPAGCDTYKLAWSAFKKGKEQAGEDTCMGGHQHDHGSKLNRIAR